MQVKTDGYFTKVDGRYYLVDFCARCGATVIPFLAEHAKCKRCYPPTKQARGGR